MQESTNFCLKWGNSGPVSREQAIAFLQSVEAYWAVMHQQLGYDQRRGFTREKRHTHKMNIYLTGVLCNLHCGECSSWASAAVCQSAFLAAM